MIVFGERSDYWPRSLFTTAGHDLVTPRLPRVLPDLNSLLATELQELLPLVVRMDLPERSESR